MRATLPITIVLAALSMATSAWSQSSGTATGKPGEQNHAMSHDCASMMSKGDQAGGKGMSMGKDLPCSAQPAASAPKTSKKKLKHDHAKFHKNQS